MKIIQHNISTGETTTRDMTEEEIAAITPTDEQLFIQAKSARKALVESIIVTTSNNNSFDGDEKSQDRMTRAIVSMNDTQQIPWVMSDNNVVLVNKAELQEALLLAGTEMSRIWVSVYQ